jgi:O-antigen/teichoic acid export membrane protein
MPIVPLLPGWFGVDDALISEIVKSLRLSVVDVALLLFTSMLGAVLFGMQRPAFHLIGMITGTLLGIMITIFLLYRGWGLIAIPCGSLTRSAVTIPLNCIALWRCLSHVLSLEMLATDRKTFSDFFSTALWLGPAKICEALTYQIDNVVILRTLSPYDVAAFDVNRKLSQAIVPLVSRVSVSLQPGLAHVHGSGDDHKFRETSLRLFSLLVCSASFFVLGVLLFNESFISLWTKASYFKGTPLTLLLCVGAFITIIRQASFHVVFARGLIRNSVLSSFAEFTSRSLMAILLVRFLSVEGVAIAAIIGASIATLIQWQVLGKVIKLSSGAIVASLGRLLLTVLTPLCAGLIIIFLWPPATWLHFVLEASLYGLLGGTWFLAFSRQSRNTLIMVTKGFMSSPRVITKK